MPVATMVGTSIDRLLVASTAMTISAIGACTMEPRHAAMPATTKGTGDGDANLMGSNTRQTAAPRVAPITRPGPKMPNCAALH
jgi:hypothetical protein